MTDFDDDYELALALVEDPTRTAAIIRAARRWGYQRGWLDGYERRFQLRLLWSHKCQHAGAHEHKEVAGGTVPSIADLAHLRGEVREPSGQYRALPRVGDYTGMRESPDAAGAA